MRAKEKGFTLIELLISLTIMALASGAAGAALFQVLRNNERNSDHMNVVRQVQNAGYWISRDAQMALNWTTTDDLELPDFLVLSWTTWNATSGNPVSHAVTYQIEDLTGTTGTLIRNYWNSDMVGANQTSQIAQHIYFDSADIASTSNASYQSSVLTVKLTFLLEGIMETREYKTKRRTNLF